MTKPNTTLITVILDRSGSMRPIAKDTIGGFNTFLADQKKDPADEARLTLVQFDHEYDVIHNNKLLAEVPELTGETYVPRGNTALLDALGRTITTTGQTLSAMPENERPEAVVVVVITDGEENASREYTKAQVAAMVKEQTDVYKWQFLFLGANIDAIQAGASVGVHAANAMNYQPTAGGMDVLLRDVSSNVKSYRSTKQVSDLSFTQAQRDANAGPADPASVIVSSKIDIAILTPSEVDIALKANHAGERVVAAARKRGAKADSASKP